MSHRVQEARRRKHIVSDFEDEVNGKPAEITPTERVKLQDTITRLRREIRTLAREDISRKEIREEIFKLQSHDVDPPRWVYKPKPRKGSPGTPCAVLSDLHWAEVVQSSETAGRNSYDLATAQARIKRWAETVVDLCFTYTVDPSYDGIVVPLLGDVISGGIHEELADTDELPPIPATVDAVKHIASALKLLADRFEKVYVPCVDGNHDRSGKKIRHKKRNYFSYGWLAYQMLESIFENDERVQFDISDNIDIFVPISGRNYLMTHGDQLGARGGDGIVGVLGPIRRGHFRISDQYRQMGVSYDTIVMGHWHQTIGLRDIIVNNSLKGWDEYAMHRLRAPFAPASQILWHTHPDKGIIRFEEVFVQ